MTFRGMLLHQLVWATLTLKYLINDLLMQFNNEDFLPI